MRCLTLADALAEQGWRCAFAFRSETLTIVPQLARHERIPLGGADEVSDIRDRIGACDLMIVDHYGLDAVFERACRDFARAILVIDDIADRVHDCDVLLDQTLGRGEADYRPHVAGAARMLLGPRYALLRPQFRAARDEALQRRDAARGARRILISFGASDPHGLTLPVARALHDRGGNLVLDAVVGANAAKSNLTAGLDRLELHKQVADMASLMVRADLAVGAPGATSWERCALGLPSVVVTLADNQTMIAAELDRSGAAIAAGRWDAIEPEELAVAVERLANDAGALRSMSQAASNICDAQGTMRVVDVIREISPGSFTDARRFA
jgi:UDP-2,4-diacetamido-2,4,6-trideoxy-beta-L-altropyranose hydrolase